MNIFTSSDKDSRTNLARRFQNVEDDTPSQDRKCEKGKPEDLPFSFAGVFVTDYLAFGDAVAAGFTSLLTLVPSGFFTSGEVPGLTGFFGSTVGLTTGEAIGLAVATGTGVAGGVTFGASVFGSHAPATAAVAANKTVRTNLLLIVLSSLKVVSRFFLRPVDNLRPASASKSTQPEYPSDDERGIAARPNEFCLIATRDRRSINNTAPKRTQAGAGLAGNS